MGTWIPFGSPFCPKVPFFLHFRLGDDIASKKNYRIFFLLVGRQAGKQVATKGGGWGGNVLIAGFVLNIGLKCSIFIPFLHLKVIITYVRICIQIASWNTMRTIAVLTSHIDYFHPSKNDQIVKFSNLPSISPL